MEQRNHYQAAIIVLSKSALSVILPSSNTPKPVNAHSDPDEDLYVGRNALVIFKQLLPCKIKAF